MHGKERALSRPFRVALGVDLRIPPGLDTDAFGSFCGTVPREGSAEEACRRKAELGMDQTGLPLGLASEGSFGPHPQLPCLAVGQELITLVDRSRNLVITERLIARRTNFDQHPTASLEALADWPQRVNFPSHALTVRPQRGEVGVAVAKGLHGRQHLAAAIAAAAAASADGLALVETDMRADRNPTRMASIRALAFKLVRRIGTPCPSCSAPGWGRVELLPGLPCRWCGTPTALVHRERWGCVGCSASEERPRADGRTGADPEYCPFCNP